MVHLSKHRNKFIITLQNSIVGLCSWFTSMRRNEFALISGCIEMLDRLAGNNLIIVGAVALAVCLIQARQQFGASLIVFLIVPTAAARRSNEMWNKLCGRLKTGERPNERSSYCYYTTVL